MNVEYKKLTENDLDVFIEMRINRLREEGATEDMPNITPHVCRHTYCSNQVKAGMNPKTLPDEMRALCVMQGEKLCYFGSYRQKKDR